MTVRALVVIEHDRGEVAPEAIQAVALAQALGAARVDAVVIGETSAISDVSALVARAGVDTLWHVRHPQLTDYAPEAWGDALAQLVAAVEPGAVVTTATERGNEVLAHLGAILGLPFVANATGVTAGTPIELTRLRWGGSLIEHATVDTPLPIVSAALHVWEPATADAARDIDVHVHVEEFGADLAADCARTRIVERVALSSGITLTTAPVVVSGGRGVGSAEAFALLETLAEQLGGAVGCSRVVTNQGWRPHADQVGQTGKRIAPELYIACGISGAIQHWVGMQAAKKILAINTDRDAPMVSKADYAVIGDLHEILPAISAELERRRA